MPANKGQLKIAVLGTRGIPGVMGGVETHCQELYPRLADMGHRVTLFGRAPYLENKNPYQWRGILVSPLWTPKMKSLEAIFQTTWGVVRVAMSPERFDLLHIHGIGPALLVPVAKLFGVRVVMTHHGPDYDRQKWGLVAKTILRLGETLGCRSADGIIAVSRHIATTISSRFKREVSYFPNGVNVPAQVLPDNMIPRHKLTPKKYILAVGRFVPEKGFHDLIEAFGNCKTEWNLVIAGDADHEDDYSRELKVKASRDSRIVLTGFIRGKELAEVFSNAGLFVLPSYHEGLPIALLEAISYDLPIVVSDIPANRELADENERFPVGDVSMLTKKLESLSAAPATAAAARPRIESEFDWDLIAQKTINSYLSVVR